MKVDCSDFQKFMDPYLDGEYDLKERRDFDMHLAACVQCRGLYETQRALRQGIKLAMRRESPPMPGGCRAALRARLQIEATQGKRSPKRAHTGAQDVPKRRRRRLALTLPVPIIFAAVLVFSFVGTTGFASPIVEDAISQHLEALPVEVPSPDCGEVDRWFQGKLSYSVETPRFTDNRTILLGGRLSNVRRGKTLRPAAQLVYGVGARRVTLLVLEAQDELPGEAQQRHVKGHVVKIYEERDKDLRVAHFRNHGRSYVVTSDLPSEQLVAWVGSAF